jgi:hypothetical protein
MFITIFVYQSWYKDEKCEVDFITNFNWLIFVYIIFD